MPKMKTKSAAKKRFKKTGNSEIKGNHSGRRHILTKKARARKRRLRKALIISPADKRALEAMLPY